MILGERGCLVMTVFHLWFCCDACAWFSVLCSCCIGLMHFDSSRMLWPKKFGCVSAFCFFWSAFDFELFLFVSLTCDEFCKCKYDLICEMTIKPFTMAHIVMFTRVAGHINYIFTTLLCFISFCVP